VADANGKSFQARMESRLTKEMNGFQMQNSQDMKIDLGMPSTVGGTSIDLNRSQWLKGYQPILVNCQSAKKDTA
jgi:hypothetical protein